MCLCGWEASIADFGPVGPGSNPRVGKIFFQLFFHFYNSSDPKEKFLGGLMKFSILPTLPSIELALN